MMRNKNNEETMNVSSVNPDGSADPDEPPAEEGNIKMDLKKSS